MLSRPHVRSEDTMNRFVKFFALVLVALVSVTCGVSVNTSDTGNGGTADVAQEVEVVEEVAEVDKVEVDNHPSECDFDGDCADDGILCTIERCDNGSCYHTPNHVACNDNNACTMDECDLQAGCQQKALTCNDDDPCTADECLPATGCNFSHVNENACLGLGDECNQAKCVTGVGCQFFPVLCEDGELTTIDMCVVGIGCIHQKVKCGNGFSECIASSKCASVACVDGQCVETKTDCDDGINCTTDLCDSNGLCQHLPMDGMCPSDSSVCTEAKCELYLGCGQAQVSCDDNNECTNDFCEEGKGCQNEKIPGCCLDEGDCNDGNPCTGDICGPDHKCFYAPPVCEDDEVGCTIDAAEPQGSLCVCTHKASDAICGQGLRCRETVGCVPCLVTADCNDGNPCTDDYCEWSDDGNKCSNNKRCDWGGQICIPDAEVQNGYRCENDPIWCDGDYKCDDQNPCTDNKCVDHVCTYPGVVCQAYGLCQVAECNPTKGGCIQNDKCDDENPCTDDSCDDSTGACTNLTVAGCVACDTHEQCPSSGTQMCGGSSLAISYTGECEAWGHRCRTHEYVCSSDACGTGYCNSETGSCAFQEKCDDGEPCTDDACDYKNGACTNLPVPGCEACDTHEECPTLGTRVCTVTGKSVMYMGECNIWNNRCHYQEDTCKSNNCQNGSCNPETGQCVYQDKCLPDGNPCTALCNWDDGQCNQLDPWCN